MEITIYRRLLDKMDSDELRFLGRGGSDLRGLDSLGVDLLKYDLEGLDRIKAIFERLRQDRRHGVGVLINDIDRWKAIIQDESHSSAGQARARSVKQFTDLITEYIRHSPGYRIYRRQSDSDVWLAYYVNQIEYYPERQSRDEYRPAQACISVLYWKLGEQHRGSFKFEASDIDHRTVAEAMGAAEMSMETDDLRASYLAADTKFKDVFDDVGRQYTSSGFGRAVSDNSAWRRSGNRVTMMRENVPAKVVVDIVKETGEHRSRDSDANVVQWFWSRSTPKGVEVDTSDDLPGNAARLEGRADFNKNEILQEVPVHPFVVVYHLSYHERFEIHVEDLDLYVYNRNLGDSLVLPDTTKNLVNTLVGQGRISFQDIIEGKGTGACVLLGGPPGVGKTLTAEVFSEATERPLLSVQAAQLGTSPDNIEKNLLNVLVRASRWNAVALLDEADVYIGERGDNLQQNAIVAAFLRILEQHTATIFMTTNRLDRVDDAIASRCLARIDYDLPAVEDQRAIWVILNKLNAVGFKKRDIDAILEKHNQLSGRDIKQLLKLGALWAANHDESITPETIDFVRQFLPTRNVEAQDHFTRRYLAGGA